ncbi:MAG: hypothetical protein CMM38_07420 [Rhodospirillaceae bacterium]|nr:hypothetical protein [Rhodospirillaceae bacterium]
MSDDLFREVDEEVRQDRYIKIWKRYGIYVSALVVTIILITVGVVVWRDIERSALESSSEVLISAIESSSDRQNEALEQFKIIGDEGNEGYRLLAKLREGAILSKMGDISGAVLVYDSIALDNSQDVIYRDLASVLAVSHGMSIMSLGEVEDRLASIIVEINPWRYSARELLATAIMVSGDKKRAIKEFKPLVDDTKAPAGVRARAAEMLVILE